MRLISFIFKAVIVVYLIIFSVQNNEKITLNLFLNDLTITLPIFVLVIALLILGVVFGMFSDVSEKWKLRKEIRRLKTSLNQSSIEHAKIKSLALSDDIISSNKSVVTEENSLVKKQIR